MKLHHRRFGFHEKHKLNSSEKKHESANGPAMPLLVTTATSGGSSHSSRASSRWRRTRKRGVFFSFLTAVTGASRPAQMHLNIILITQRVTAAALTLVASGKQRPQNRREDVSGTGVTSREAVFSPTRARPTTRQREFRGFWLVFFSTSPKCFIQSSFAVIKCAYLGLASQRNQERRDA